MEGPHFNFNSQLRLLWRHKGIIGLVALVAGATALLLTTMRPPLYQATTKLMAGYGQPGLTAAWARAPGGVELTYLQDVGNQIEVMRSYSVLEHAVIKLEPELTADPEALQQAVMRLAADLSIQQVESTSLVTVSVVSTSPTLAREKANAVAEAYIDQIRSLTLDTIEQALEDTTDRLLELQSASVDLAISPGLTSLTSGINTALPALVAAAADLRQLEQMAYQAVERLPVSGNVTAESFISRLESIKRRIASNAAEATDIAALARTVEPVAAANSYTERSATIAAIESRTRAIVTRLESLTAEVTDTMLLETERVNLEQWRALEEQLRVASATGTAVLEQAASLYVVQEEYIAAGSSMDPATQQARAREADANFLNRIIKHTTVLTATLESAADQAELIDPPEPVDPTQWRFGAMAGRVDAAAAVLQDISKKLQPGDAGEILLTHADISAMEVQSRAVTVSLAALSSELAATRSDLFDQEMSAKILDVQESLGIADNAADGLSSDIGELAARGGDVTSYATMDSLRQELQLALLSGDTSGTRVVDTAIVTYTENFFTRYRGTFLALFAGLLVGSLGVMVSRNFDLTVRDGEQTTGQLGLALLAAIPRSAPGKEHISTPEDTPPRYLESFRLLRASLGLDSAAGTVLLVTGTPSGEDKTVVAANLARVVAMMGRRVLLIDGDLRRPGVAAAFGLPEESKGLSDFLIAGDSFREYVAVAGGVSVLPGGTPTPLSAELFPSPRFKGLLEAARRDYDVTIVDSAPVTDRTDTVILARAVDDVLLVLRKGASKLDAALRSRQALEAVGARVSGYALVEK